MALVWQISVSILLISFLGDSQSNAGSLLRFGSFQGYLSLPPTPSKEHPRFPGVLLIPDWWGLDDQTKLDGDRLAEKGFATLSVDFYRGKTTKDLSEANHWNDNLSADDQMRIMKAGLDALMRDPRIDRHHLAVVGWGKGGDQALKVALTMTSFKAVVLIDGDPILLPIELKKSSAPVLGIFADGDTMLSKKIGDDFDGALLEAHIEHIVKIYPNSKRGFSDSIRYATFNPVTGPQANQQILDFLNKYLVQLY